MASSLTDGFGLAGEQEAQRHRDTQHPLPHRPRAEHIFHEVPRTLGHAACAAAGAKPALALRKMEERKLVRSQHGSRAQRYEHRMAEAYSITAQQQAALAVLLLRGPQTASEILSRTERLAKFADVEDLRHCLDRLIQRDAPLAVRIPKGPGQREDRYMHLLCGPVDVDAIAAQRGADAGGNSGGAMADRIAALEARVEALEEVIRQLGG